MVQRPALGLPVAAAPSQLQRFGCQRRHREVRAEPADVAGGDEGASVDVVGRGLAPLEGDAEQPPRLPEVAADDPEPEDPRHHAEGRLDVAAGVGPVDGGAQVLALGFEQVRPPLLLATLEAGFGLLGEVDVVAAVAIPHGFVFGGRAELLQRVLADRFEHAVARRSLRVADDHQRLVGEALEQVEHLQLADGCGPRHRHSGSPETRTTAGAAIAMRSALAQLVRRYQ